MGKPKIAFVLPALNTGGAQRVVTSLANSLIQDYEVCIITFINEPPFYILNENIKIIPCVDRINPSKNIFQALESNYILFKRIRATIKKEKTDLLISFLTTANILSILVSKFNKVPVIISERNNPYLETPSKIWQLMRYITYSKANYVIVQTEIIKNFYIKKIKKERLVMLPNPISKDLSLKRDYGIPKKNIILNSGRLTYQKGQDMLIRAFSKTTNSGWKLVLAGEGPNRIKYEKLINKLGLNDKVSLVGNIKDIHNLYNQSKIFAFSSLYEGFPNALIEAMHFGLACVSTNCPTGPSELIIDGENGYLVPMNDEQKMVDKLNILMQDEEKRELISIRAVKSVKKFEISNVVLQWKDVIDHCLINKFNQ